MKVYFISDQHLADPNEEKCQALLHFFKSLQSPNDCSHLFLVGDIFDVWAGAHEFLIKKWHPFNVELLRLVNIGVQVHYFEGNHDMYLKEYYFDQLGVQVHTGAEYFEINGQILRVEHGDQMDPEDTGYLMLRRFLRSTPISYSLKNMPEVLFRKIAEQSSNLSRQHHSVSPDENDANRIRNVIENHVHKVYRQKPFDIFVAGHVHLNDDRNFNMPDGKVVRAINLGFQQPPFEI